MLNIVTIFGFGHLDHIIRIVQWRYKNALNYKRSNVQDLFEKDKLTNSMNLHRGLK